MDTILEKLEMLMDDIERDDSLTKDELAKLKKALKEKKTSTLETTGRFKKD